MAKVNYDEDVVKDLYRISREEGGEEAEQGARNFVRLTQELTEKYVYPMLQHLQDRKDHLKDNHPHLNEDSIDKTINTLVYQIAANIVVNSPGGFDKELYDAIFNDILGRYEQMKKDGTWDQKNDEQ